MSRSALREAVVVAVAVLLMASACSKSDDAEATTPPPVCGALQVATKYMTEKKVTFTGLVAEKKRTETNAGISGLLFIGASGEKGDLGPYKAAITYLADRNTAWAPEFATEMTVPDRTPEVIESARRLDRDLSDGLC